MEGPKNKRKKTLASQGSPPQKRGKTNTYSSMKEPKKKEIKEETLSHPSSKQASETLNFLSPTSSSQRSKTFSCIPQFYTTIWKL
jgi:capsid portal protein